MCISPSFVWIERGPKWEQTPVPCKMCWRCKANRVNGYVGRSLAEAKMSVATCAITLTYAPRDDLADKVLTPRHFQLFIKLLRRAGHKVRYLVAGEYGDLKGRAHFHAILFFSEIAARLVDALEVQTPLPFYNPAHLFDPSGSRPFCGQIPSKRMSHIREWPHGHVIADWSANEAAIRYVCKYLLADDKNNAWFSLSKKPSIGSAWFAQKAALGVFHGVMPSSFEYLPPGGDKEKTYLLSGATRRDYLNSISRDPAVKRRLSEWVLKSFEKYEAQRWLDEISSQPLEVAFAQFAQMCAEREVVTDNIIAAQHRRDMREQLWWVLHGDEVLGGSYVETS